MQTLQHLGLVLVLLLFTACTPEEAQQRVSVQAEDFTPSPAQGYRIEHTYYTLSYSSTHRQAEFASYYLSPASIQGGQARTDDFRLDPKVKSNPVKSTDYQGSGYDRGHLCPAADMALNLTAMSETFFMSNMSPMTPSFNRGIWSKLEDWVRDAALQDGGLYVITGPVLSKSCGSINSSITIPCSYYKIVFKGGASPKMMGFLLSNAGASGSIQQFVITVDALEQQTGIDFFPQLEDGLEQSLESKVSLGGWKF
ncbi:MAG: DNA/RNA non-specific endonuclease [Algoriphagus sp.]|nr:DNA/RNA non-specific endonuclease [Algoriphagus sp.]